MGVGISLLFGLVSALPAQSTANKLQAPDAASIAKGQKAVQEVFGFEIDRARTYVARKMLAAKMLVIANDLKETTENRWVLYHLARDLAADNGDVGLTLQIVDDLQKAFVLGSQDVLAETAERLAKVKLTAGSKQLLDVIDKSADEALQVDDHKNAVRLLTAGNRVAQTMKDSLTPTHFESRLRRAKALAKEYDDVVGIDEHMGLFQCFRKNDWVKGLPLLVNSQNADLANVVKKDLANPSEGKDRIDVGDAWLELADRSKGSDRVAILRRAWHWHRQGTASLFGLAKARMEDKVKKEMAEIESFDVKEGRFSLYSGIWQIKYANNWTHEYQITDSGSLIWLRNVTPENREHPKLTDSIQYLTRQGDSVFWVYNVKDPPEKMTLEDSGLLLSVLWKFNQRRPNPEFIGKGVRVER
jgi:hypothetical protein